jgi:hypothetical protein
VKKTVSLASSRLVTNKPTPARTFDDFVNPVGAIRHLGSAGWNKGLSMREK